jgi:hypothetical protein
MTTPITGACRCGRTTFEASAAPLLVMACHCTGCQKMSSSAFSLSAAIPTLAFRVTAGEPVIGGLHGALKHYFCPHCLTWMFTRPDGIDFFVNVRPTLLEGQAWCDPFAETYTSEKLPWATTAARHSYSKFPPMEAYEGLMAEFAAHIAKA